MRKLTYFIPFLAFFIVFQSCVKSDLPNEFDTVADEDFKDLQFQSENFGNPTTGNFLGVIKDENWNIVEGVQIQIGNAITTTDRNGVFIMNNVNVFENFAYIKAEKTGYIPGSRVVIPKPNGVNRIEIQLLKKEPVATIISGEASTVNLQNGVEIQFEGSFISDIDGSPYNGPVQVVAHYLRPNSGSTFTQMPGNLFAQTASNDARSLETYGMVSVNLFSPTNQPLNIDPNTTATIEFPVDFSQTAIAPETIALWSFDEEVGYWKEEGEATKNGDAFIAEVNHFSWWNCDVPIDLVELCFTLDPPTSPTPSLYLVAIQRTLNNQYLYYGYATSAEVECGWIPKDETVKISVFAVINGCANQRVHEEIVGGFSTDSSIDISFTPNVQIQYTTVTGTVTNCNGNPLTNGYLYVNGENISSITDGIININVQHCNNENITLQIFDSNAGQWAYADILLNGSSVDAGSLSTCGNTGGIYNGDVRLNSQDEIDAFGQFNYERINGNLLIGPGGSFNTNISNLSPLLSLEHVTGTISISHNPLLQNLNGLGNLISAGRLRITNNLGLISLLGIENIESLSRFDLIANDGLSSLDDLQSWDFELSFLHLSGNGNLSSLSGLGNVLLSEDMIIEDVSGITTLEDLTFGDELDFVQFYNNDDLVSLVGLENVTSIDLFFLGDNDSLESLAGLDNLLSTRSFHIGRVTQTDISFDAGNPALRDFCAIRNLFLNGTYVDPYVNIFSGTFIENNAFNPSIQMIISGNCSL